MSLSKRHEVHERRFGRNLGLGLVLGAFIAIIFGLTIVKIERGDYQMQPQAGAEQTEGGNGG